MNSGLWRYDRHPNYFRDAVVWGDFYVTATSTPWGAPTILSPLPMWWLLTSLSGKPLLEKKLSESREGYEDYIATTTSFFSAPKSPLGRLEPRTSRSRRVREYSRG